MLLQFVEGNGYKAVLVLLAVLALELQDHDSRGAFCCLVEIFVQCRHGFAVCKLELFQVAVCVLLDVMALYVGIVVDNDFVV